MSSSSAASIFRMGLAGTPMKSQPAVTILPGGTRAPAPTCAPSSITAPSRTIAPMPMRTLFMTRQPWTTARWPIVTLSPTMHGCSGLTCSTELSGTLEVRQFRGGQSNPTYHVSAGGREYVLRRKPPGKLLPSAHAVDREYRVITALGKSGFPVPRTFALCEDDSVIGTAFYVMDCVHGRIITDPAIPDVTPRERGQIYDSLNDVLARLHTTDWQALGLADFGRPGNYFARQIHRWTQQYRASETEKIESMERLIPWLPEHIPAGDETALVHGDFRLGNVIVHPTEPRVVAGTANDPNAQERGRRARPLADSAWKLIG